MAVSFLAKNLEILLERDQVSSSQLAEKCNVEKPVISRILTGKTINPQVETLRPIAEFFGVTIDQLIGESSLQADKTYGIAISMRRLLVPLIEWKHVPYWLQIKDNYKGSGTVDVKTNISPESYALVIDTHHYEPRFGIGSTIIVDPKLAPENRNYIMTHDVASPASVIISQVIVENKKCFLKSMTKKSEIKKVSQIDSFGVITESRIHLKT